MALFVPDFKAENDKDETVKKILIADESLYGYRNHRIWRKLLLDEMKQMLIEQSVQIHYDSKFNGVVSDRQDGVTFRINQTERQASLLVGSDGIFSAVRKHIAPDVVPEYTGTVGCFAHIKRNSVAWPYDDYERNGTIQGKPGALFFLPEDPDGEVIMIGMQVSYPEQSREDLERLQNDHDKLIEFFRKGYDEHGPTARSIIDRVTENKETLYIWPFLKMPRLERWHSHTGRVIIVADGAHTIPPSSGQGVNQALEDAYSLTLLLSSLAKPANNTNTTGTPAEDQQTAIADMTEALSSWQQMRQERIDRIADWVSFQNVQRLPEEERKKLIAEGKIKDGTGEDGHDMSWLYRPNLEWDSKN